MSDFEARARLTALGWTVQTFTAWPDCECIPAIAWLAPGEWDVDRASWDLWERGVPDNELLPPIPREVLETLA